MLTLSTPQPPYPFRTVRGCQHIPHPFRRREARARLSFFCGIGCSVLEWEKNIAALADRHRVYAFDMLGHGLTDKPRKTATPLRTLPVSRWFHRSSLGGRIALECARLAREDPWSLPHLPE